MARISTKAGEILSASLQRRRHIKTFTFIPLYSTPYWFIVCIVIKIPIPYNP